MKKKFNFRLKSVLKLREFEEEKAKLALGVIVAKKQNLINQIEDCKQNINSSYVSYEKAQETSTTIQILSFFPNYIQSIKNKRDYLNEQLKQVENDYQESLKALSVAMGDKKVVEKLKDKKKKEHKKQSDKQDENDRQEIFSIRKMLAEDQL